MSDSPNGVGGAVAKAVKTRRQKIQAARDSRADDWRAGDGVQGSLLPVMGADAERDGVEFLDAEEDPAGDRGPGRPKGSRNKRTQHTLEYLQAMGYEDPLRGMAELWSRPASVLADELGCTVLEAMDRQMDARKAALPYWHQKLPQAIVIDKNAAMTVLTIDAAQMLELLQGRGDEIGKRGFELLAPLLDGAAVQSEQEDEGDDPG